MTELEPVKVIYKGSTVDGEILKGELYTLSKEPLTNGYIQLAKKYPKEKLINLCLQME